MSATVLNPSSVRTEIDALPMGSTRLFHGALDAEETHRLGEALNDTVEFLPLGDTILEAEYMLGDCLLLPEAPPELEAIATPLDALLPPAAIRSLVRVREFNKQSQYHTPHIDNMDSPVLDKRLIVIVAGEDGEWCEAGSLSNPQQLLRRPVAVGDIIAINNMCPEEKHRKLHMLITASSLTALILGWTFPVQSSGTLA